MPLSGNFCTGIFMFFVEDICDHDPFTCGAAQEENTQTETFTPVPIISYSNSDSQSQRTDSESNPISETPDGYDESTRPLDPMIGPSELPLPNCIPYSNLDPKGGRYFCGVINEITFPPGRYNDPAISYTTVFDGDFDDSQDPYPDAPRHKAIFNGTQIRGSRRFVKVFIPPAVNRLKIVVDMDWDTPDNHTHMIPNLRSFIAALDHLEIQQTPDLICNISRGVEFGQNQHPMHSQCSVDFPDTEGYIIIGIKTMPRYILKTDVHLLGVKLRFINDIDCTILTVAYGSQEPDVACREGENGNPPAQGTEGATSYWINSPYAAIFLSF
jgi:hypothetical protein